MIPTPVLQLDLGSGGIKWVLFACAAFVAVLGVVYLVVYLVEGDVAEAYVVRVSTAIYSRCE